MYDKIKEFTKKFKLWERKCNEGDVSYFPIFDAHLAITDVVRGPVVRLVQAHLSNLYTDFSQYFKDIEERSERLDWMRDPIIISESSNNLPIRLQENQMDLFSDRVLKIRFSETNWYSFGVMCTVWASAFWFYMYEVNLSALTHIPSSKPSRGTN